MRTSRVLIPLLLVAVAVPAAVEGAPPGAPINDDYLNSLQLNAPGSKLERKDTLRDVRDTSKASVQKDVFAPPRGGGPAEVITCPASPGSPASAFGRTVWYDFYPDVRGFVQLQASGYNTALAVVPFDPRTATPDFARRQCINQSASTTEKFLVNVAKGKAYTVQIGGVGGIGGNLEFLFDFLADTDGDNVLDDVDKCDTLKGPATEAGCPVRLKASVTLKAKPTAGGIQIVALRVKASRGSRVTARCGGCAPQAKKAGTVSFRRLRGKRLGAGNSLVIRVTKKNSIGSYVKYKIKRGDFTKIERCLNPGSKKPRKKCG